MIPALIFPIFVVDVKKVGRAIALLATKSLVYDIFLNFLKNNYCLLGLGSYRLNSLKIFIVGIKNMKTELFNTYAIDE